MKTLKEVPWGEDDGFLRCVGGMMPSFLECVLVSGISPIIADLPDGPYGRHYPHFRADETDNERGYIICP